MKPLVVCVAKREQLYAETVLRVVDLRNGDDRIDYLFLSGGDEGLPYENMVNKLKEAQDIFLAGNWDVFVTIESDHVIPNDAIEKLNAVDADVVYGLYVLRYKNAWNVTEEMGPLSHIKLLSDDPERARESWGKVVPCVGHGMGCTLFRRGVLQAVEFRVIKPSKYAADWALSMDCQRLGFEQKAHLGVVCGHIWGDKVMWPTSDGGWREE